MKPELPRALIGDETDAGRAAYAELLGIVENQLRDATPPAVPATLARLMARGLERRAAVHYIACALSVELFEILEHDARYDEARYVQSLDALPALPYDDDAI